MVIVVKCAVWDANVNIRRSVDLEFLLHLNAIMRRKSVDQLKQKKDKKAAEQSKLQCLEIDLGEPLCMTEWHNMADVVN